MDFQRQIDSGGKMPTENPLADHRRMHEDEYFRQKDQELIERARRERDLNTLQQRMAEMCGVTDPDALRALEKVGYSAETASVLHVAPLVQVAWADGHVSQGERLSILEAAVAAGVDGGPAYQRLLGLLRHRPSQEFFDASLQAIRSFLRAVPSAERLSRQ